MIRKPCCSRFLLHKFVHLKFFLDPIQKRAPARSVQLEAAYLEALYCHKGEVIFIVIKIFFSVIIQSEITQPLAIGICRPHLWMVQLSLVFLSLFSSKRQNQLTLNLSWNSRHIFGLMPTPQNILMLCCVSSGRLGWAKKIQN